MNRDSEAERQLAERTLLRSFLLLSLSVLGVGVLGIALVLLGGQHSEPSTIWLVLSGVQAVTLVAAADLALVLRRCVRNDSVPNLQSLLRRMTGYLIVAGLYAVLTPLGGIVGGADAVTALVAGLIALELLAVLGISQRRIKRRSRRLHALNGPIG